jgi:hypothetical protein
LVAVVTVLANLKSTRQTNSPESDSRTGSRIKKAVELLDLLSTNLTLPLK